eukprot:Tbor_TRINITY_DN2862_c0_g1::TRINITY_DN2862_c0_g1_i1::g.23175::m.23175
MKRCPILLIRKVLSCGTILEGNFDNTNPNRLVEGVATTPDGRVFKGTFDRETGAPCSGCQMEEDGDVYRGSYNNRWQRTGEGEAFLLDGTHYKGVFEEDELVKGVVRIPDGMDEIVFEGTLKEEMFVKGIMTQKDFTYEGEFEGNCPHGKGKLTLNTGAELEGTFYNGKLHGRNCRQKMESGITYIGDFENGVIKRGCLYTPNYTYDGCFGSDGRANGEGTQTYLATSPKLIFTGLWVEGNMNCGTCHDEYGNPVDWMENHDIQKEVFGEKNAAIDRSVKSHVQDALSRGREVEEAYTKDAKEEASKTGGKYPSKQMLGYQSKKKISELNMTEMMAKSSNGNLSTFAANMVHSPEYKQRMADITNGMGSDTELVNISKAKQRVQEEMACDKIKDQYLDQQMNRFMSEMNDEDDVENDREQEKKRVSQNRVWQSAIERSL